MEMRFPPIVLTPTLMLVGQMLSFAHASSDPSALCMAAAGTAAELTGVPYDTLLAISVVETGRGLRPWPWTINLGGEGYWLDSAEDAAGLVADALNGGATNIDIGCFQLNYRWHASAFPSIEDMLDPEQNARYAAEYLAGHYARTGDWSLAAAAYHSATPEYADRYQARFEETAAELGGEPGKTPDSAVPRRNGFPLLIAGVSGFNGSLVPSTPGGLRLFGGP
jgi:Transglycosylase SLT domain